METRLNWDLVGLDLTAHTSYLICERIIGGALNLSSFFFYSLWDSELFGILRGEVRSLQTERVGVFLMSNWKRHLQF